MSIHDNNLPSKKLKAIETNGEDRISNLPDDIIGHILSRLPTKHAVGTSVLSRDWIYKWTFIYDICVDRMTHYNTHLITSGVDRVLDSIHESKLRSFSLSSDNMSNGLQISAWISSVLSRGVQNLVLDSFQDVILARGLNDYTLLTELKLSMTGCSLQVHAVDSFNNLKSLKLERVDAEFEILNDQSSETGDLLLNFPVLQVLQLKQCSFFNVKSLEIWAPELIRFVHESAYIPVDYEIKVRGPKLIDFCLSNSFFHNFVLHLPPIHEVHLDYYPSLLISSSIESKTVALQAHELLEKVTGLTCLRLPDSVVQALVHERRFDLPQLHQLKRFEVTCCAKELLELLEFLQLMPILEHLDILFLGDEYMSKYAREARYNYEREPLPPRLKQVSFSGFRGRSKELNLITLLVENAKKLERVFVYLKGRRDWMDGKILDQLQALSSKSSSCVTILGKNP